jgi:hypothetical protein
VLRAFGVGCFFFGVVSLGLLALRRGKKLRPTTTDHILIFTAAAGTIIGIIIVFSPV